MNITKKVFSKPISSFSGYFLFEIQTNFWKRIARKPNFTRPISASVINCFHENFCKLLFLNLLSIITDFFGKLVMYVV